MTIGSESTKVGVEYFRYGKPFAPAQTASGYLAMPSWIITCRKCRVPFEHTKINEYTLLNFLDPTKPEISSEGVELACPKCGHTALYNRSDLFYRH